MKISVGLLFIPLVTFAQAVLSNVVFATPTQIIAGGVVSEQITVEARDSSGTAIKGNTICTQINSSSASGEFSTNGTTWGEQPIHILALTLATNQYRRNFYYRDTTGGTHTLTLRAALKPSDKTCPNWPIAEWPTGWTAMQQITISSGAATSSGSTSSSTPPISEQTSPAPNAINTSAPSEPVPSLVVKVSGPATVSVGADATFSATVFGVKKEPIPNARVVWSFGNGAIKEGASVRYGYNIPGSYLVVVDASSGGFAGSARMTVVARKPDVRVSGVLSGANGFVEIENRSNAELDVSGWGITSGGSLFTIPDRTIILPSAKVAFSAEVTKLLVSENDARLLFPNGMVAAGYVVPAPTPTNIPRLPTGDTPFKGGTPNIPPLREVPKAEDVSVATSAPAAIALSVADDTSVPLWQWLLGITGVCAIGIGALVAFRFKPTQKDERSDEAKLAAKITINSV